MHAICILLPTCISKWNTLWQEKRLIRRLAYGDKSAFRKLMKLHFDELYHYILVRVKSPDITKTLLAEICFQIWTDRKTLTPWQSFSKYLEKTAKEVVLTYLRQMARNKKFQQELYGFIQSQQNLKQAHPKQGYDSVIKTVHNNLLKQQLLYKLTRDR